jgi:hypothetical protein
MSTIKDANVRRVRTRTNGPGSWEGVSDGSDRSRGPEDVTKPIA